MVLTIGFGVAATMTAMSLYQGVAADPAPTRSSRLFVPQIDAWGPAASGGTGEPPGALTYMDARALQKAHKAKYQSAVFAIGPTITDPNGKSKPFHASGYAVSSEFFPLVDVQVLKGAAWSAAEEDGMPTVAVISGALSLRLFGTRESIGRTFNINHEAMRVIGIISDWNPQPRFYDVFGSGGFSTTPVDILIPITTAGGLSLDPVGNMVCTPVTKNASDSCVWMSFLVYLETAEEVKSYRSFLDAYARDMQNSGRFAWAPNNRLRALPDWLDYRQVVPSDTRISIVVAFGLLAVCVASVLGLLVVTFDQRSKEVGVRRALGATRGAVATQFLVEAGLIGVLGGIAASIFTFFASALLRASLPPAIGNVLRIDSATFALTVIAAVAVTILAAAYPSLKVANPRLASLLQES
jgi:putative ABC transport system permease protein